MAMRGKKQIITTSKGILWIARCWEYGKQSIKHHPIFYEIVLVLAIKIGAIYILYVLFFSPEHQPVVHIKDLFR